MKTVLTIGRGFCMGAADVVPGVSGGTVALVFGIYARLLDNVRRGARAVGSAAKLDLAGVKRHLLSIEWSFLIPLAVGLGAALISLASLIEGQLERRPEAMAGLFFGLVAGSIVVAWGLLRERGPRQMAIMLVVGGLAFFLLGFQNGPAVDPPIWAFFMAGAIAICAMILPGISGSFLLLMMGMYAAVLRAVHDRSASDLLDLAVFTIGATVGLTLFSTGLGWLIDHYHDQILAGLIGLMIGSFRVLWPWPNGVGIISETEGESIRGTGLELPGDAPLVAPIVLGALAFGVVVALSLLAGPGPVPARVRPVGNRPPVASS